MPQINRVRVNNVKYNFGTQFYDDFMMRFSCKNTMYDLANGGGKSVLMLLLLQTIIPNCTLDDKQPVEKLFRTNSGSTTIHSLVEWKLDSCDVKNGYKYMTCGFCARKGREHSEDETEGSEGTKDTKSNESASIDYFNYCIFYREFGDNDIKNLPLTTGNERITYNGLKNYLKELEKRDFGVQVKVFERKGDYQSFINDYGIFESHWEIIRGINKTEGHVRTYFENTYKTTRKVVEDLLIEEIIEKSYNNRIRGGNNDDEMAKTLLDIKDKLMELAKRREDIEKYDRQIEFIKSFADKMVNFKKIYERKEAAKNMLIYFLSKAKAQVAMQDALMKEISELNETLREKLLLEEKCIDVSSIAIEQIELRNIRTIVDELNRKLSMLSKEYEEKKKEITLAQTAIDYKEYLEHERTLNTLTEYMENCHKNREDITSEAAELASAKYSFFTINKENIGCKLEEARASFAKASQDYEEYLNKNDATKAKIDSSNGILSEVERQINELESDVSKAMKGASILVSENASQELIQLEKVKNELEEKKKSFLIEQDEISHKKEYCINNIALNDADIKCLQKDIENIKNEVSKKRKTEEQIKALKSVYGENDKNKLICVVEKVYDEILRKKTELTGLIRQNNEFVDMIASGTIVCADNISKLLEYLESRYENQVVSGADFLMNQSKAARTKLLNKYPFLAYSVIAKENYEYIIKDKNISNFDNKGIAFIIDAKSLCEEDNQSSDCFVTDGIFAACRNLSFIYDEAGKQAKLKSVAEENDRLKAELAKFDDRMLVVREDYQKIKEYVDLGEMALEHNEEELKRMQDEVDKLTQKKDNMTRLIENFKAREDDILALKASIKDKSDELFEQMNNLKLIVNLNQKLDEAVYKKNELIKQIEALAKEKKRDEEILFTKEGQKNELRAQTAAFEDELEGIKKEWEMEYETFYIPKTIVSDLNLKLSEADVDAKFGALKRLIMEEMGDLSDKERLMENCRANMKRIEHNMEYRLVTLEMAQKLHSSGELISKKHGEIIELMKEQDEINSKIKQLEAELSGASTQLNRLEGSISHAENNIIEKYGSYERMEIPNPVAYKKQHMAQVDEINAQLSESLKREKECMKLSTSCLLMEKDLEKIVKSMGMDPEMVAAGIECEEKIDAMEYEKLSKKLEELLKEEAKQRDSFIKDKENLCDKLNACEGYEISMELKRSIEIPGNKEGVDTLVDGLLQTCECIALEKERISRGIEDMELIKDNFENRCVQICTNIRAELDRLPKLSKITLDDEIIPIVSLSIPYVKEEIYKDRMNRYINAIVSAAENFKTTEEKLKYIKSRLTWKRLFSVIVTDMDSIKLNLYKRERIKEQSRYLRYEEAVGSTGQSQGIYIQFLVSIINYIASINAGGKETAVIGKTIFIDNPFGAAKDVYIWEPIFKMLKTNHVQLIVPARGATPAITGRFDVNYILGQKLVNGKQQTVVVDYTSQVTESELEYERLSFSQESFDFV